MEADTISLSSFKQQLQYPPLAESESIQQSLQALKSAENAWSLRGRKRLAYVQVELVHLLAYLEGRKQISLFPGICQRCTVLFKALPQSWRPRFQRQAQAGITPAPFSSRSSESLVFGTRERRTNDPPKLTNRPACPRTCRSLWVSFFSITYGRSHAGQATDWASLSSADTISSWALSSLCR